MNLEAVAQADWLTLKIAIGVCSGVIAAIYVMRLNDNPHTGGWGNLVIWLVLFACLLGLGWPFYGEAIGHLVAQ